ncbi:MAG: peptidase, partial [Sphingobacteriales bacterium]
MKFNRLLFLPALVATVNCFAQVTLPVPVNLQATYIKGTRTTGGAPGKNYWQNSADYTIKVNFNPQSRYLNGTVSINYINN